MPQLHPEPPRGANIEFVVPSDPLVREGVGSIRMRVFERGVGETLSCGTGVAAAALAVRHWAGPAAPDRWTVEVPGRDAGGADAARSAANCTCCCPVPATLVYSGEVTLRLTPAAGRAPASGQCDGSLGRREPCRRTFSTRKPRPVAARCTL